MGQFSKAPKRIFNKAKPEGHAAELLRAKSRQLCARDQTSGANGEIDTATLMRIQLLNRRLKKLESRVRPRVDEENRKRILEMLAQMPDSELDRLELMLTSQSPDEDVAGA